MYRIYRYIVKSRLTLLSAVVNIRSLAAAIRFMRKTATLNLRVSSEFKKRLIDEAKRDKRSVTNYLEAMLSSFWDEKQKTSAADRERPKKGRQG